MADRYDRTIKVSQGTIDEIKKMGMSEAIKRAQSGQGSREFLEGAKRMYGGNRVGYSKTYEAGEPGSQGPRSPGQPKENKAGPPAPKETTVNTQNASSTKPAPPSPPKAAIERRLTQGRTDRPGGQDVNRPEYAERLKALEGKSPGERLKGIEDLRKQAAKDRKIRVKREGEAKRKEEEDRYNASVSRPGGSDLNRPEYKDRADAILKSGADPTSQQAQLKKLAKQAKKDRQIRENRRYSNDSNMYPGGA